MKIIEMLAPLGSRVRKGNKFKTCKGITIHDTGNPSVGANAAAHGKFLQGSGQDRTAGYHLSVDDIQAVRCIPSDEICEHTGGRAGNDTTICIEICVNNDGNLRNATRNAAELAALEFKKLGIKDVIWKKNIWQHYDWTKKNCPEQIRSDNPFNWMEFINMINEYTHGNDVPTYGHTVIPELKRLFKYKAWPFCMRGADVKQLQNKLNSFGFDCGIADGIFGKRTLGAVLAYQKMFGLKVDGIVGSATWNSLFR